MALVGCCCLPITAPLLAQTAGSAPRIQQPRPGPVMPPRDTSARPATPASQVGTASVVGRVLAADGGQPLRRAMVTAMPTRPPEAPRRGEAFRMPRGLSARTDEQGRYTIGQMPPGEYTLTARRAGYVEATFGQITNRTPGRRVAVAEGAAVGPLDFQLHRGGVITGRVVDDGGEPAERVSVRAVIQRRVGGQTRIAGTGQMDQTDDQGHFRIFGIPPGDYLVVAEPGERRGGFMGGGSVQGIDIDTIPTYGPGTVNPADALKVQVQAGSEVAMDIQLVAAKVATVRGRVLMSSGDPLEGGMVRLQPASGDLVGMGKGGPVTSGGQFEIDGVAPGTYTLVAQGLVRGPGGPDGPVPEIAVETITVEGEDVTVPLTTSLGSTARGRLVIEGDASPLAGRELRIMSFTAAGGAPGLTVPGRGRTAADLTFEVTGLRGEQVLTVQSLPEGCWIKDIRVAGQPALDGFDYGNGRTFTGVEIVVSTRPTGLRGNVTMPTNAAADDYAVVLFPEDESRWERIGPGTAARIARPGLDGAFTLASVRPGTYYLMAIPAAQAEFQALSDPEQLRMLASRARTVEVRDGQMASLTLTLVER